MRVAIVGSAGIGLCWVLAEAALTVGGLPGAAIACTLGAVAIVIAGWAADAIVRGWTDPVCRTPRSRCGICHGGTIDVRGIAICLRCDGAVAERHRIGRG